MYSMVLMAALTTGTDLPDGRRRGGGGGGCCGCYGGMGYGGGGCYGGMGYGGCYGGWGGGYGMGGGWGGGYGGGYGRGYAWGGYSPMWGGGYAYSPNFYGTTSAPIYGNNNAYLGLGTNITGNTGNLGAMQSMYFNPGMNQGNAARIIVRLPADAKLTIDGEPTQSISNVRVFESPPLEQGKTYHYTLRAERRRNNQTETASKTIEVRAGQPTQVTLDFRDSNRQEE